MPTSPDSTNAGRSAQREYQRRHTKARARAEQRYGRRIGAVVAAFSQPTTTAAWAQGAQGEIETARAFETYGLLPEHGVRVIHDRRIPGHGRANIDHLIICPVGVIVVDTKSTSGCVQLSTVGLINRRELLLVNGRDRTSQLDRLTRQIEIVCTALERRWPEPVAVRGALSYPHMDRPWLYNGLARDGLITVDQPRTIARLAKRPGPLGSSAVEQLARVLECSFPAA